MHFTDDPANVSLKDGILHLTALYAEAMEWNDQTKTWMGRPWENTYVNSRTKQRYISSIYFWAIQTRDRHGKVLTEFGGYMPNHVSNYHLVIFMGFPSRMTGTKGEGSPQGKEIDVFSQGCRAGIQANMYSTDTLSRAGESIAINIKKCSPGGRYASNFSHTVS